MSTVRYATSPPTRAGSKRTPAPGSSGSPRRPKRRDLPERLAMQRPRTRALVAAAITLAIGVALVVPAAVRAHGGSATDISPTGVVLSVPGALTLAIFLCAIWAWIFTSLDDTLVALLAAAALILTGALPADGFFATLGDPTIWLLICASIIASGVAGSGLALRGAAHLVAVARSPRALAHLVTAGLVVTAFAIPATSGRAVLALPIYAAIVAALPERAALHRALGLLFPTVILLSAVGSLLGAGAHLITSQLLAEATGEGFSFVTWLVLGLPLAVVSSHLACELILFRFTDRAERRAPLSVTLAAFTGAATPVTGKLSRGEWRALALLGAVIALWSTEPLHGISPEVVALLGALAAAAPKIGITQLGTAVKQIPWNLLLFLAATLALGMALTMTGAVAWIGDVLLSPVQQWGAAAGPAFLLLVIAVSLSAHLVVQSRSARSAVLIPIIIAFAPGLGVDPAAAAFASTAAAGFCHTLPSSAKPVALFARTETGPGIDPRDLFSLSAWLAPLMFVCIALCSFLLWPALGLPAFL
ncbi:SLC13 family permease [Leucobacter sp. 1207-22]